MNRLGVVGLLVVGRIGACECAPPFPPCQSYWHTEIIFLGTVTNVVFDGRGLQRQIFLTVDRAYKGIAATTVELFDNGMCDGPTFRVGERYLMYTSGGPGMPLPARGCTRSRHVSEAEEDLHFLNNLDKAQPVGSIFGKVAFNDGSDDGAPIPGAMVTAKGHGRELRTKADDRGRYRFDGLKPGAYSTQAEHPAYYQKWESDDIELHARGCAQEDFLLEKRWPGVVSGRVIAVDGSISDDVRVTLLRVASDGARATREFVVGTERTRDGGGYRFENIPPGRYKLALNELFLPTKARPFATTYYPNSPTSAAAAVINIPAAPGTEFDIHLPPALRSRTLRGQVLLEGGKPAGWMQILVRADPGRRMETAPKVGTDGTFTLDIFEGIDYIITAFGPARITSGPIKTNYETAPETLRLVLR